MIKKLSTYSTELSSEQGFALLDLIASYASSWTLLQKFSENKLSSPEITHKPVSTLSYEEAKFAINQLKNKLFFTNKKLELFAQERELMFERIIASIYQTFDGQDLYPSIEEKAAHLLYFILKDYPFLDGNKRIGSFLFILFLAKNKYLVDANGERKFNNNALIALTLMVSASDPKQKDIMILLIINLLSIKAII